MTKLKNIPANGRKPTPTKSHNKEIMRSYSFEQLHRKGKVTLTLGEIVTMKGFAIKYRFEELAEKLRKEEAKLITP